MELLIIIIVISVVVRFIKAANNQNNKQQSPDAQEQNAPPAAQQKWYGFGLEDLRSSLQEPNTSPELYQDASPDAAASEGDCEKDHAHTAPSDGKLGVSAYMQSGSLGGTYYGEGAVREDLTKRNIQQEQNPYTSPAQIGRLTAKQAREGIIWAEVLKRPSFGVPPYKR